MHPPHRAICKCSCGYSLIDPLGGMPGTACFALTSSAGWCCCSCVSESYTTPLVIPLGSFQAFSSRRLKEGDNQGRSLIQYGWTKPYCKAALSGQGGSVGRIFPIKKSRAVRARRGRSVGGNIA